MTELRAIDTSDYAGIVRPRTFGRPPRLEWLAISQLVVDPGYQRELNRLSRTSIRRIAAQFNWSMFSPVIVAPAGGNRFAIVDGQHRTTAAALSGFDKVPCAIIECERGEQAAAFRAINGNVTRLHTVQIFHAALLAGEADAVEIAEVCAAAGVTICRYKKPTEHMKPGETLCTKVVGTAIRKFGRDVVIKALTAIRQSGDGAIVLVHTVIYGSCEVLSDHAEWTADQKRLNAAFDDLSLGAMLEDARAASVRLKGTSVINQFESYLVDALAPHFKGVARAVQKPDTPAPQLNGSAIKPITFNGVTVDSTGAIRFKNRKLNVTAREALFVGHLARGLGNPIGHEFLTKRVWSRTPAPRDPESALNMMAEALAARLSGIGLQIKVVKGAGIVLRAA